MIGPNFFIVFLFFLQNPLPLPYLTHRYFNFTLHHVSLLVQIVFAKTQVVDVFIKIDQRHIQVPDHIRLVPYLPLLVLHLTNSGLKLLL